MNPSSIKGQVRAELTEELRVSASMASSRSRNSKRDLESPQWRLAIMRSSAG